MAKKELALKKSPRYTWSAEDVFELTGKQWEIVYNSVTLIYNNALEGKENSIQTHLALQDAIHVVTKIFNDNVESGKIKAE